MISVIPAPVLPEQSPMWEEQAMEQMAGELDEWSRPLRDAGVPSRTCVALGTPFEVLERIADDEDALMIVVGRSGRGGLREMLLGSVPHALTHHALRPVLVVPVR
jgi:nucleotide-binding universal stress UspA family protein